MEEIKTEESLKQEKIDELSKKVKELLEIDQIEELLKKSVIEFEIDGVKYRVSKPNFKQKQETYEKRIEKFTELLKNDKYMLEEDLKKIYLKRGIDIDSIVKSIVNKSIERDNVMIKLGELVKNQAPDSELQLMKTQVEDCNKEIEKLSLYKSRLLETSIENQIVIYVYSYFTYLIAEKLVEDKWVRVWNSLDEFYNASEKLSIQISYYSAFVVNNDD